MLGNLTVFLSKTKKYRNNSNAKTKYREGFEVPLLSLNHQKLTPSTAFISELLSKVDVILQLSGRCEDECRGLWDRFVGVDWGQ